MGRCYGVWLSKVFFTNISESLWHAAKRTVKGEAATPQVVIAKRTYNKNKDSITGNMKLGIEMEKILQRKSGLSTIENWYKLGMPMLNIEMIED